MFTVSQIKQHLTGLGHGGTLNKVRNIDEMLERSAAQFLLKVHPLESIRVGSLTGTVHDNFYDYSLQSDFGAMIDLIPQDNRQTWDSAYRSPSGAFDLQKAIRNKVVSIEGRDGTKMIRINWKSRQGKTLNTMDSLTANGTWSSVGSAANLKANSIFKVSGNASIEFDLVATGDGIQNTTMSEVDMTDEDETADIFIPIYLPSVPTSITAIWGNDVTTNYWTSTAVTTQADGTAFRVGWNTIKFSWSTATESGTVDPTAIDAFKLTVTNATAMNNIRVDNIIFSIGRNFDMKYYSKYLYKNSAGTYLSKPSTDDDYVTIDNDTLPIYLFECLTDMAHQMEGTDSAFDLNFASGKLKELYPAYKGLYPSQAKKQAGRYGSNPARGRW